MTKITKLTRRQEENLIRTYSQWLAVGRSCELLDREKAIKAIGDMYVAIGEERPAVMFFSSPIMCVLAYAALSALAKERSQLGSQLWSQLRSQLGSQLESQLESQLANYWAGNQWCAWEVFYDFCRRIGINYTQEQKATLDLWLEQSKSCHWWWPYKGLVLASERHTVLCVNAAGQLHCEDGPAVAYSDGWSVWALNGIRLPEGLVTQTVAQLSADARTWIAEPNVEIRREYLRKVGIERALSGLDARVLDSSRWGPNPDTEYELLAINLGSDVGERRALKMLNPSIGCWHIEGVEDDIETVEQAHNWRASGNKHTPWKPALLT